MTTSRLNYLDWVRILAVFLGLVYHAGRPFDLETWHIKGEPIVGLDILQNVLTTFRLPLLFFVSGVGTVYALKKRASLAYLRDRSSRLLIPLLLGMLLIVPPQVYLERISHGMLNRTSPIDFDGSYWQFLTGSWLTEGPYPDGNISWHHLWFLLYLFFYSAVMLPLFLFWRSVRGQRWLARFESWLKAAPGRVFFFVLPMIAANILLRGIFAQTDAFVDDWAAHAYYLQFFVLGYLLYSRPGLLEPLFTLRRWFLAVTVTAIAFRLGLAFNLLALPKVESFAYSPLYFLLWTLRSLAAFAAVLAVMSYASRYLNRSSGFLERTRHWVYPFYIFHQTVIVVISFFIVRLELPSVVSYLLVLVVSLLATLGGSELVQHHAVTRWLFGVHRKLPKARQVGRGALGESSSS